MTRKIIMGYWPFMQVILRIFGSIFGNISLLLPSCSRFFFTKFCTNILAITLMSKSEERPFGSCFLFKVIFEYCRARFGCVPPYHENLNYSHILPNKSWCRSGGWKIFLCFWSILEYLLVVGNTRKASVDVFGKVKNSRCYNGSWSH